MRAGCLILLLYCQYPYNLVINFKRGNEDCSISSRFLGAVLFSLREPLLFTLLTLNQPLPFLPKPGGGSFSLSGFLVFKNYFNIIIHYVKSSFVKNLMWFLFSTWDPDCYISCTSHPWPCGLLGLPWAGIFLCLSIWFVLANGVWLDVICATSDKSDTFKRLYF